MSRKIKKGGSKGFSCILKAVMQTELSPDLILQAYAQGVFPMAEDAQSDTVQWIRPYMRGQLPIRDLHISKNLKKRLRQAPFEVRIDTKFTDVMRACAAPAQGRSETWINDQIVEVYSALHDQGHAHSVECWHEGRLVGGLYGLKIGAAFFGESMFSAQTDASKVALVHLVARLDAGGFKILDTQFMNPHLEQFGAYEIPQEEYMQRLQPVLAMRADFRQADYTAEELLTKFLTR